MAGYGIVTVNLQRDGFNTPWGFRLSGGKDFKTPLIVTKVVIGTPADTVLFTGDVILNLENYDTRDMLHKKAQEIIRNCGGSMLLKIQRTGASNVPANRNSVTSPAQQYLGPSGQVEQGFRSRPLDSAVGVVGFIPKLKSSPASPPAYNNLGMDYGIDFNSRVSPRPPGGNTPQQGFMINKINTSLSNAIWQPPPQEAPQPYIESPKAVCGLVNNDNVIRQSKKGPSSQSWSGGSVWQRPQAVDMPGGLSEPGWTPYQNQKQPAKKVTSPGVVRGPVINERTQMGSDRPAHIPYEEPAWKNSLRSSNRPTDYVIPTQVINSNITPVNDDAPPVQPHQPHLQSFVTKADGSVQYSTSPTPAEAENAQVKHLQFNSPLNLYSKGNAQDVLVGQTAGKPGEGTLNLGGGNSSNQENNFKNSQLALMIQQEEWEKKMRASKSPLRDMPPAVGTNFSKPVQINTQLCVNELLPCRQSPSIMEPEPEQNGVEPVTAESSVDPEPEQNGVETLTAESVIPEPERYAPDLANSDLVKMIAEEDRKLDLLKIECGLDDLPHEKQSPTMYSLEGYMEDYTKEYMKGQTQQQIARHSPMPKQSPTPRTPEVAATPSGFTDF